MFRRATWTARSSLGSQRNSEDAPRLLASLSAAYEALGRWRVTRVIGVLFLRSLARLWLERAVVEGEISRADDITVVIGTRNRADYRLENALRSIRSQTYPADLIRVVVVDYGSDPDCAARAAGLCRKYGAKYVRVDGVQIWSRSRCLNIGIRQADTKFLLSSDADIVFPPDYLSSCVEMLRAAPTSIVGSVMLDLPEHAAAVLEDSARTGDELQFDSWKQWCRPRHDHAIHPSICATYTAFFQVIRGYDEFYEVWGNEDEDLYRRFRYLGLKPRPLGHGSFYMHQWHPESARGRDGKNADRVRRNQLYVARARSLLRNDVNWGIPGSRG